MAGDKSETALYQALADRFQSLEASHERLREQFDEVVQENKITKNKEVDYDMVGSDSDSRWGCFPGFFGAGGPYRSVLENMGHAVHVCRASSGEIIYWYVCIYMSFCMQSDFMKLVCLFVNFIYWCLVVSYTVSVLLWFMEQLCRNRMFNVV